MKIQDLKSCMIVETQEKKLYLVVGDKLIGVDGFLNLSSYHDDLKHTSFRDFNIIKVYNYKYASSFSYLLKYDNLDLIWERKEHKLTQEQIKILKALKTLGFNWIARDKDNDLYAYNTKPKKLIYIWDEGSSVTSLNYLTVRFDFIKWEDEEPINIDDLLNIE
jgi:hypothetical protein